MERKINPDIHIICGKCGCGTMFDFEFSKDGSDDGEKIFPAIFMICNNCSTLTNLNEVAEDNNNWKEIGLTKLIK